ASRHCKARAFHMHAIQISPDLKAAATASFEGNTLGLFSFTFVRKRIPGSKLSPCPPSARPTKSVLKLNRISENATRPLYCGSSASLNERGGVGTFSLL